MIDCTNGVVLLGSPALVLVYDARGNVVAMTI